MKALQLGEVQVFRIEEMVWEIPHTFLFPDLPAEALAPHMGWLRPRFFTFPDLPAEALAPHMGWLRPRFFTEDGRMRLSIHAFVVRTPHHTVLVDTCVGNDKERAVVPDFHRLRTPFLARLADQAGITPEQVDYVFCTHFHVDHVGWNTRLVDGRWQPTFPQARYLFHRPEFEHYTGLPDDQLPASVRDSVLPVAEAGKAELVDGGHAIGDHLVLEPTPGHTPGHCSVRIATSRGPAVITGDLLHTPVQVHAPHWSPRVDHDAAQAVATRAGFIARHAEAGSLVLGTHFAPPTACRFERNGGGHRPRFD